MSLLAAAAGLTAGALGAAGLGLALVLAIGPVLDAVAAALAALPGWLLATYLLR